MGGINKCEFANPATNKEHASNTMLVSMWRMLEAPYVIVNRPTKNAAMIDVRILVKCSNVKWTKKQLSVYPHPIAKKKYPEI